jgi:hypothetical protein
MTETEAGSGPPTSRAARRVIEPGSATECKSCGERIKFQAKVRAEQVICNVYEDGAWDRVEHYHLDCYLAAGHPYGEPEAPIPKR